MTFTPAKRTWLGLLTCFPLLFSLDASAGNGADWQTIKKDCVRYFARAAIRNFDPKLFFKPSVVGKFKIDPATVRIDKEAANRAIGRWIEQFQNDDPKFMAPYNFVDLHDIYVMSHYATDESARKTLNTALALSAEYELKKTASIVNLDYKRDVSETINRIKNRVETNLNGGAPQTPPSEFDADLVLHPRTGVPGTGEIGGAGILFNEIENKVRKLLGSNSKSVRLLKDLREVLLGGGDVSDALSPMNGGIAAYWSRQVSDDPVLFTDALDFYSRLQQVDRALESSRVPDPSLFSARSSVDVWPMALESTSGDPLRAIRVLSIFGHDNKLNDLFTKGVNFPERTALMNVFAPTMASRLQMKGALAGLTISDSLKSRFMKIQAEYADFQKKFPGAKMRSSFRSADYHYFGGAMLAAELLRRGHTEILGVNTPVFASEVAGTIYKRVTMENEYMDPYQLELFHKGYPKKDVMKPAEWFDDDFELAKIGVRHHLLFLDHTREQQLSGAKWIDKILRAWDPSAISSTL